MACILIADGDENLVELVTRSLSNKGNQVIGAHSGSQAIRALQHVVVDLMILDVVACMREGTEACQTLGTLARLKHMPVLFLHYPGVDSELVDICSHPFEATTRDYLSKPFKVAELEERVEALLKHSIPAPPRREEHRLTIGPLTLDLHTFKLKGGGQDVLLTPVEFDLLRYLMEHAGEVISSERLLQEVWKYPPHAGSPEVVRWHLKNLRTKINLAAGHPSQIIFNVPHHGYTIPESLQG